MFIKESEDTNRDQSYKKNEQLIEKKLGSSNFFTKILICNRIKWITINNKIILI